MRLPSRSLRPVVCSGGALGILDRLRACPLRFLVCGALPLGFAEPLQCRADKGSRAISLSSRGGPDFRPSGPGNLQDRPRFAGKAPASELQGVLPPEGRRRCQQVGELRAEDRGRWKESSAGGLTAWPEAVQYCRVSFASDSCYVLILGSRSGIIPHTSRHLTPGFYALLASRTREGGASHPFCGRQEGRPCVPNPSGPPCCSSACLPPYPSSGGAAALHGQRGGFQHSSPFSSGTWLAKPFPDPFSHPAAPSGQAWQVGEIP